MTDTSDNKILAQSAASPDFQERCRLRFIIAAISVVNEVVVATVNGTTAAGNATLHFAATPSGIVGYGIADQTTPAAIGAGNTILSTTATTAVMAAAAITPGVGGTDVIVLTPQSHTQRLAFAGALFNGTVGVSMLAEAILANATNRTNCVANPQQAGGNIVDSDIDFQISSIFTGLALSRAWT
jgi:hypothetical protein